MLRKTMTITVLLISALSVAAFAQEHALNENLKPLEGYLGSWEGIFNNTEAGQELKDYVSFEVMLNGNAVRSVHEVTGGYGGETIFFYDQPTGKIRFWYYTNIGQWADGHCEFDGKVMKTFATHHGGNVSGWVGTSTLTVADSFDSGAKYYQGGKWSEGHSVTYKRVK